MALDVSQTGELLEEARGLCEQIKTVVQDSLALASDEPVSPDLQTRYDQAYLALKAFLLQNPRQLPAVAQYLMTEDVYEEELGVFIDDVLKESKGLSKSELTAMVQELLERYFPGLDEHAISGKIHIGLETRRTHFTAQAAVEVPKVTDFATYGDVRTALRERLLAAGISELDLDQYGEFAEYHFQGRSAKEFSQSEDHVGFFEAMPFDDPKFMNRGRACVSRMLSELRPETNRPIAKSAVWEACKDHPSLLAFMATSFRMTQAWSHDEHWKEVGRPYLWTDEERAEIVRRLVEKGQTKFLALFNLDELPLKDQMLYQRLFREVYAQYRPEMLEKYPELFGAVPGLEQVDTSKGGTLENVSEVQAKTLPAKELGAIYLRNHARLLERMTRIGVENMPFLGLHGTKCPGDAEKMMQHQEGVTPQVVTVLQPSRDPNLALTDLYDVVGGDKGYFLGEMIVLDVGENGKTACARWGENGEFKNWALISGGATFDPRVIFMDYLKISVPPFATQVFEYFRRSNREQSDSYEYRQPHAEKSDQNYASGAAMKNQVLGVVAVKHMPMYLRESALTVSQEEFSRYAVCQMLFVQWVTDKILDMVDRKMVTVAGVEPATLSSAS